MFVGIGLLIVLYCSVLVFMGLNVFVCLLGCYCFGLFVVLTSVSGWVV